MHRTSATGGVMSRMAGWLSLLLLFGAMPIQAQVLERVPREDVREFVESDTQDPPLDLRERHLTLELLESELGRWALERYRTLREAGELDPRIRLMEATEGDEEQFYVRNVEESQSGDPVYDLLDFRLVRVGSGLDTGGRVEIWVQREELHPDRVSEDILDEILQGLVDETSTASLDSGRGAVEIIRDLFGEQPMADGTGTLKILIADIQDGWTEEGDEPFIAGFFDAVHLLPPSQFEESNQADMLFINSRPGIYRPSTGQVGTSLHTMAHELQHLIHATYGALSVFQNEGQSELAELLTGFPARSMSFLNSASEVRGDVGGLQRWFYRFRTQQRSTVLYDYQRAQLFHAWLEEQVGPEIAGSLTRSDQTLDRAYQEVLQGSGKSLPDLIHDFYVAAYGIHPDGSAGSPFTRPQLSQVNVFSPGVVYDASVQPWVQNRREMLYYGGALYTQWFGIRDLDLSIEPENGIRHTLISRRVGESGYEFHPATNGQWNLPDDGTIYEEVVLISVNTAPIRSEPERDESRTFLYSGEWTPSTLMAERLVYHAEPDGFVPVPEDPLFALATRISPAMDGSVRYVRFSVNTRESAILGEGTFRLHLREATPSSQQPSILIPGSSIASRRVEVGDLAIGENYLGVDASQWELQEDEEYFVSLELEQDLGGLYLELLLDRGLCSSQDDEGCPEPNDPRYDPPRTYAGLEGSGGTRWGVYQNRNNWVASVTMVGEQETCIPEFPDPPISDDVRLLQNYPNPFAMETTIEVSLPEQVEIRLSVHDLLGREVQVLSQGVLPSGVHRIPFDGQGLASGIYFYRLILPGDVKTRRMTLVQ
ncbi:MAG: T9SS type A sorting domain-containing protein [Balneolaceae bacterium]